MFCLPNEGPYSLHSLLAEDKSPLVGKKIIKSIEYLPAVVTMVMFDLDGAMVAVTTCGWATPTACCKADTLMVLVCPAEMKKVNKQCLLDTPAQ